jgi:hypothetical protein
MTPIRLDHKRLLGFERPAKPADRPAPPRPAMVGSKVPV